MRSSDSFPLLLSEIAISRNLGFENGMIIQATTHQTPVSC